MLDELVNLDVLGETDEGQALLDNHLRILMTQMSAEERTVMELLSAGKDGEATEDALVRLQEAGFVVANDEGYAVNGALIEFVSRGRGGRRHQGLSRVGQERRPSPRVEGWSRYRLQQLPGQEPGLRRQLNWARSTARAGRRGP